MRKAIQIKAGSQFGRWTVEVANLKKRTNPDGRHLRNCSLCRCTCGNKKEIDNWNLVHGRSTSCGCGPQKAWGYIYYNKKVWKKILKS